MKIIEWFKSLLQKTRKNDYMLEEGNNGCEIKQEKKNDFVPRVDIDSIPHQKTREEILKAISCLYGAIKEGNMEERNFSDNIINKFLKENPDNIVVLVDLMIKDAKDLYESLGDDKFETTTIQGLIPGSYIDISAIIEEYIKENEIPEK